MIISGFQGAAADDLHLIVFAIIAGAAFLVMMVTLGAISAATRR